MLPPRTLTTTNAKRNSTSNCEPFTQTSSASSPINPRPQTLKPVTPSTSASGTAFPTASAPGKRAPLRENTFPQRSRSTMLVKSRKTFPPSFVGRLKFGPSLFLSKLSRPLSEARKVWSFEIINLTVSTGSSKVGAKITRLYLPTRWALERRYRRLASSTISTTSMNFSGLSCS